MIKLKAFVTIYSGIDEIITLRHSDWLIDYVPNSHCVKLWNHSRQFTEDPIRLRTLKKQEEILTFTSHV